MGRLIRVAAGCTAGQCVYSVQALSAMPLSYSHTHSMLHVPLLARHAPLPVICISHRRCISHRLFTDGQGLRVLGVSRGSGMGQTHCPGTSIKPGERTISREAQVRQGLGRLGPLSLVLVSGPWSLVHDPWYQRSIRGTGFSTIGSI